MIEKYVCSRKEFEYELEKRLGENHKLLIDISYIRHGGISIEFTSRFSRNISTNICNFLFNGKVYYVRNANGEIEIIMEGR